MLLRIMRCIAVLTLIAFGWFSPTAIAESHPDIQSIDAAYKLIAPDELPPAAGHNWQFDEFVGATRTGTRAGAVRTWYRFDLQKPEDADQRRYSLYFWRYNMSLTVFMNGQEIGGDSYRDGYETLAWNHPQLIEIQSSNWRDGANTFHVRFQPSPFGGTFAPIKFGPDEQLKPVWQNNYNWKVRINEYLLVFGLLVSLSTLLLYLFRRRDSVYLWFFGVSVCWCVLLTHFVIYFNPVPYQYWLPMVHMALDTWILCLFGFVNRLLNIRSRKVEMVMTAVWLLALSSHAFSPREYFWSLSYYFHLVLSLGMVWILFKVLSKAVVEKNRMAIALMAAVFAHLLLSFHDMWLFFSATQEQWETATQKSQFGVPLLLAVFLLSLLQRFRSALDQSERLNEELEARVNATRQALEESYAEQRDLDLRRAAAEERQKIYRDLHDDVGSKLLTIVHEGPESRVAGIASSALESLREAVYRANYKDEPFLEFLTMVREETKLRAAGQGFECHWFEDPDLPNDKINAKCAYHLGRILREVVTNALHHSGGNSLAVSIEVSEGGYGCIHFEVTDNGVGGVIPEKGRTSGIRSIMLRAEEIDGQVCWAEAESGGMVFTLQLPPVQALGPMEQGDSNGQATN